MHHYLSLLLPVGILLLPLASTTPISTVSTLELDSYGHWELTYTSGGAASGYRWEYVNANYSSSLETSAAVQCKQLYDPTVRTTTRSCDDASFGYEVTAEGGQSWITVRQTVQLGGASGGSTAPVAITGKSAIVIACGKGANGRTCEGVARVEAGPVGAAE